MNLNVSELLKLDVNSLLKKREVAIGLTILVVAIFVARFIYMKQATTATLLKDKLKEQAEINRLILDLEKRDADLENLKKDITTGTISTVKVVDMITEMARKRNINISSINPRSQVDKGLYWEYTFEIEMEADYQQCKGLLGDIEHSGHFFKVNSLSVNSAATGAKTDSMRARVRMGISAIAWKK